MKTLIGATLAVLLAIPLLTLAQDSGQVKKAADGAKSLFDEKADAKAQIATALANSKRNNRRVLIQWGGNDHASSQLLAQRLKSDPGLSKTLLYEYDVVFVASKNNAPLAAGYGANINENSVPFFTVLDAGGQVLHNQSAEPFALNDGKGYDAKKLQEFLVKHQAAPLKAEDELAAGLARAGKNDRRVFLHFGAPWCGWCKKLEAWLLKPEIAAVFHKDFEEVHIDIDRMQGAAEVHTRYRKDAKGGIPWFVMLDSKGQALATSDAATGNIGFPDTDAEIVHFVGMLKTSRMRMTDAEIDGLRDSLKHPPKAQAGGK
jgi:thiol-disulfide isomerase/thioredoxin